MIVHIIITVMISYYHGNVNPNRKELGLLYIGGTDPFSRMILHMSAMRENRFFYMKPILEKNTCLFTFFVTFYH
jgi:hypothetical protein